MNSQKIRRFAIKCILILLRYNSAVILFFRINKPFPTLTSRSFFKLPVHGTQNGSIVHPEFRQFRIFLSSQKNFSGKPQPTTYFVFFGRQKSSFVCTLDAANPMSLRFSSPVTCMVYADIIIPSHVWLQSVSKKFHTQTYKSLFRDRILFFLQSICTYA